MIQSYEYKIDGNTLKGKVTFIGEDYLSHCPQDYLEIDVEKAFTIVQWAASHTRELAEAVQKKRAAEAARLRKRAEDLRSTAMSMDATVEEIMESVK